MKKIPVVYCASIATETNTFSPLKTNMKSFKETFFAKPNYHPKTPTLCSALFPLLRKRKSSGEIKLIEGTATWAEPGGLIESKTWNDLKKLILKEIKNAGKLDIVLLGLHGAMIAKNCVDCEGDLVKNIRKIVGPNVVIGATFDPHSHLSKKFITNINILTVFKEFPHTDFVETAKNCINLSLKTFNKKIKPRISLFDVKMMTILPTSKEPMRSFVDKIKNLEKDKSILSISIIHGFMAGNSPDLGAKILIITDNDINYGNNLSFELGMKLFKLRKKLGPKTYSVNKSLIKAKNLFKNNKKPVLIADIWDNPGGGVAGDSTVLINRAISMKLKNIALGSIWDPEAVRLCHEAGEKAIINLSFGGKISSTEKPLKKNVLVKKIVKNAFQKFGKSLVPMGDCACITFNNIEIVLNSNRSQTFSTDVFEKLGIEISNKKILIVKSTNHFYNSFHPYVSHIIYASVNGIYPNDPKKNKYTKLKRKIWPIFSDPHSLVYKNENKKR